MFFPDSIERYQRAAIAQQPASPTPDLEAIHGSVTENDKPFFGGLSDLSAVPEGLAGAALKTERMVSAGLDTALSKAGMDDLVEMRHQDGDYIDKQLEAWSKPSIKGPTTLSDLIVGRSASDPRNSSHVADMIRGVTEGLALFVGGTMAAGPLGGLATLTSAEGFDAYSETYKQTGDFGTSAKVGAATGLALGVGAFLPFKVSPKVVAGLLQRGVAAEAAGNAQLALMFNTAAQVAEKRIGSAAVGAVTSVGAGVGSRASIGSILRDAGYEELAKHYDPLDGYAMLADTILGAGFGALAHGSAKSPVELNDQLSDALTDAFQRERNAQGVVIPVTGAATQSHIRLQQEAVAQMVAGMPIIRLPEADLKAVAKGSIANPNFQAAQDEFVATLRNLISQYPGMGRNLTEFPTNPEPLPPLPPPRIEPETESGLSSLQQITLHELAGLHPDVQVSIGDGQTAAMRDLPELIRRFAAEDSELTTLLEVGANCFIE